MDILLGPNDRRPDQLRSLYQRAFQEATELYITSAYLTDWDDRAKVAQSCQRAIFLVGTDFGLTRKAAMRKVLRWIPKRGSFQFRAMPRLVSGGFHPKLVAWRSQGGKNYAIIGSSNLSRAGFAQNYEANVFCRLSSSQFSQVVAWIDSTTELSFPVSQDWIDYHYKEAPVSRGSKAGSQALPVKLTFPVGPAYERIVRERRKQQSQFRLIGGPLLADAKDCAKGRIRNREFWQRFWRLWSDHPSRFQGSGIQFRGKSANWKEACGALVTIMNAAKSNSGVALDHVVSHEIDRLRDLANPARGAWLSEMLCHYFPNSFPVLNAPVRKWLSSNRWRGRRGATEGQRYTELAQQLRTAVRARPAGARNLAELDNALWLWVHNRKGRVPGST